MPVFNEIATLRRSIERTLDAQIPGLSELIVVDDGSTDGSVSAIEDLVTDGTIALISAKTNEGKGAAVRRGISVARGRYLAIMDADLEYDPSDYAAVLRPILDGEAAVAYGTRSFGSHTAFSFWYVIGNRFLALWASFLFNTWITDIETCFKVAPLDVWRSLDLRSDGFGMEAEVTGKVLRSGMRIFQVPIGYRARGREDGKKLKWTDGLAALWILLRIRLTRPPRLPEPP